MNGGATTTSEKTPQQMSVLTKSPSDVSTNFVSAASRDGHHQLIHPQHMVIKPGSLTSTGREICHSDAGTGIVAENTSEHVIPPPPTIPFETLGQQASRPLYARERSGETSNAPRLQNRLSHCSAAPRRFRAGSSTRRPIVRIETLQLKANYCRKITEGSARSGR